MDKEISSRKDIRLKNYDYSSPGGYFLTICTLKRRNYFWKNVGATIVSRVVQQLKGYITKRIGRPIWQKLFIDHII